MNFSVLISVYKNDNPAHFDKALKSIGIDQTLLPNEIILVVDGPTTNDINRIIEKW